MQQNTMIEFILVYHNYRYVHDQCEVLPKSMVHLDEYPHI